MPTLNSDSPAEQRYLSLISYKDLNSMVENADCEDLYLECKEQTSPTRISREVLAKTLSGFSNTSGGVVIWGAQTDKKDGNDVITQLLPIGNVETFKKRIANIIPTLTTPSITGVELRVIKKNLNDSKGFLVGYIPKIEYRPTQSIVDNSFYLRSGDQFTVAPYEFIQRMFAAHDSPSVKATILSRLLKYDAKKDDFIIPICVSNESNAVGREILVSVEVMDFSKFTSISGDSSLNDISSLNTGKKLYSTRMNEVLHRGFPTILGNLHIKPGKKKVVTLVVTIYADKMTAAKHYFKVSMHKSGPSSRLEKIIPEY